VRFGVTRGLRRLLLSRRAWRGDPDARARMEAVLEAEEAFDPAEFAEFLRADDAPIPIDPQFKQRLRRQLWSLVSHRPEPADEASAPIAPESNDAEPRH
jgi:hypothetical protein